MAVMDTLSTELLIQVLSYLQLHDLLSCSQVSKRARDVIVAVPYLQYKIELERCGYEDNPLSQAGHVERLSDLRKVQDVWSRATVSPDAWDEISVPFEGHYDCAFVRGGMMFSKRRSGSFEDSSLEYALFSFGSQNPKQCTKVLKRDWFSVLPIEIAIDLQQNLMARSDHPPSTELSSLPNTVSISELDSQDPQPRRATLTLSEGPRHFGSRQSIRIFGHFLLVVSNPLPRETHNKCAYIYHWPTETLKGIFAENDYLQYLDHLIVKDQFILVIRRDKASSRQHPPTYKLNVHVIGTNTDKLPTLTATFELPPPGANGHVYYGFDDSMNNPAHSSSSGFFPSLSLIGIRRWSISPLYDDILFAPSHIFLPDGGMYSSTGPYPARFPWNAWGPKWSRQLGGLGSHAIIGYRVVTDNFLFDFAPYRVAKSSNAIRGPPILQGRNIKLSSSSFQRVDSNLPYTVTPVRLPKERGGKQRHYVEESDGPKVLLIPAPHLRENIRVYKFV